jgi:hypothetical protein
MRPSAKVWKGISNHLNRRRRKIGFILGTSLLLTTSLGYYLANESSKNYQHPNLNSNSKIEKTVSKQTSFITEPGKQLLAINTPSKGSKFSFDNSIKVADFSFIQNLLQRNADAIQNDFTPGIIDDSYLEKEQGYQKEFNSLEHTASDPLSIESVLNSYRPKTKKLSWQVYFTPTVSYRKLNDNTINDIIAHKPAFGFQLGTVAKYPLSKNTKLRAGLQFNVNRYEIRTNDSYTQLATIRLVDRNGVDYVRKTTNYNNFSGYQTNWLQNLFVQLSAPIGVEVKLAGDNKMQFGVASTIQPTYILGDKAYLISADYKNYTEMPNLVRRLNVNTSLETYVGYSTGHINWQVGPQFRYQLLSSYLKKYPVKENLFDFGLRVGMSFNK